MALPTATETIGDYEYVCTAFPARKGLKIVKRLVGLLSEPLGVIGESVAVQGANLMDTDVNIAKVLESFAQQIATSDADELIRELCSHTTIGRGAEQKPLSNDGFFDSHFAGNYGDLIKVILFVLKANKFADFFGGALTDSAPLKNWNSMFGAGASSSPNSQAQ